MKQLSRSARFAGIAAALVAALTLATTAHADPLKCKQEIAKDTAKYTQARAKALQKCHEAVAKAKLPLVTNCLTEPTAAGKIAKADSKLRAALNKQCGGDDKTCSTTGDNDSLASIGWPSACPNFENGSCTNVIANCNDISDCLICVASAAVDQSMTLSYGALDQGQFGSGSDINKCQTAIGKNATKFLNAKNKALAKCEKGLMKVPPSVIGPCPDTAGAVPAITKAESKKIAGICKACGGPDKTCLGADNLTPAQIGFASTCPSVTVPPSGPACGGPIATLNDIVLCVDCVNEFKDDCLDPLAVPALKSYPTQCNPGGPPCAATPQNTATPCPTATPGVTCPTQVQTDADGPGIDLDTGWTGQSHDGHAPTNNRITLTVSGCSNPDASTCGVCTTGGPIANAGGTAFNTHRCVLDTSVQCTSDLDCVNIATCSGGANNGAICNNASECPGGSCPVSVCSYFFGSPLPLSAGGVSVCVTNQITAPITGTIDIEAGTTSNVITLLSRVHTGPTTDQPCPTCIAGSCSGGLHTSDPCVINGHSDLFGDVSFDCPPDPGANVGNLPITLAYATGTQTRTLSASNPSCRAPGFSGSKCFCDTCNNLAATPCTSNADCVLAGATICGGRRCAGGGNNGAPCNVNSECPGGGCSVPGAQTKPNDCDDSTCSPTSTCVGGCNNFLNCTGAFKCVGGTNSDALCTVDSECPGGTCNDQCPGGQCLSGNEGTCAAGPFEQFCAIQTFRGCTANSDCPLSGDTCTLGKFRDCFLDNGVIGGGVDVTGVPYPSCGGVGSGSVGALFCVPPTSSGSVNSVSGLPGLGRVVLPYTATFN